MPPRTDCSAAMSCGGFLLASDPRVVSTGSRCAIDKAAVLTVYRARPGLPSCKRPRPEVPRSATRPDIPAGSDNQAPAPHAARSDGLRAGVIPTIHRFSTETPPLGLLLFPATQTMRTADHQGPSEQVLRYASRLPSSSKVRQPREVWITCAVTGIACAQPVWKVVDKNKLCHLKPLSPAETHATFCGANISSVEFHPQRRVGISHAADGSGHQ